MKWHGIIINIFKDIYKIELSIKEPNDIVYKGKKIGGILVQSKTRGEKLKYIVAGIGINTNKEKFSIDIENIATSIKKEFGINIDTQEFISQFCNKFEELTKRYM